MIDNGTCKLNEVIGCRDDIMVDLMGYGVKPKLSFTIMESVRKGKGLKDEWVTEMKRTMYQNGLLILVQKSNTCSLRLMRLPML